MIAPAIEPLCRDPQSQLVVVRIEYRLDMECMMLLDEVGQP